ncbi:MAG: hypothetical protein IKE73_02635 [Bacilli bacterium]|nr:hypothetical protein [Bacilli bacterium]
MGKSIDERANELGYDGVRSYLEDKVEDYISLMGFYCSTDEMNFKRDYLINKIRKLNNDYFSLRDMNNNEQDMSDDLKRVYNEEKTKFNITKSSLEFLFNEEDFFLNFFISSGPNRRGVLFVREDGNVLYNGINESLCKRVLSAMEGKRKREGKEFNYTPIIEDDNRQMLVKDEVIEDLSNENFIGPSIYRYFFNGDGYSFNEAMHSKMKREDVEKFNKYVDDSVFLDKNDSYNDYLRIYKEALMTIPMVKSSKTY